MRKKEKVEKLIKDWFAKTADYERKRLKQDAYHICFVWALVSRRKNG